MILSILVLLIPFVVYPGLQDPSGLPKTLYTSVVALLCLVHLLSSGDKFVVPASPWLQIFVGLILISALKAHNHYLFLSQFTLDFSGAILCCYVANKIKVKTVPVLASFYIMVLVYVLVVSINLYSWLDTPLGFFVVNPKYLSLLIFPMIIIAFGLWINSKGWGYSLLVLCACAMGGAYLGFSFSFAGVAALGVIVAGGLAWVGAGMLCDGRIWKFFVALFLSALLFGFGWLIVRPVVLGPNPYSFQMRTQLWESSAGVWEDGGLLGVGRGNWQIRYPFHVIPSERARLEIVSDVVMTNNPHSDYWQLLTEVGPLGLVAYLCILIKTMMVRSSVFGYWLKLALFVFIFEGIFWSLSTYAVMVPFIWILIGMIWADARKEVTFRDSLRPVVS